MPSPQRKSAITAWLERASPAAFTAYGVVTSFTAYFCMYGFRKPFAAAKFAGHILLFGGLTLDVKALYVLAQVLGYFVSKLVGIKVVSEVTRERRALAIVACIAVAEVGLVLFGLLPAPYRAVGMVVNGLPLGMIWGLVFGFLEGRRVSDFLGAGLSASFIVASGFVKSVGVSVLDAGVPEAWMSSGPRGSSRRSRPSTRPGSSGRAEGTWCCSHSKNRRTRSEPVFSGFFAANPPTRGGEPAAGCGPRASRSRPVRPRKGRGRGS